MMTFIASIHHLIFFKVIKSRRMRWVRCGMHGGDVFTGFWLGGPREETMGKTKV
jgi:hypothetical protein